MKLSRIPFLFLLLFLFAQLATFAQTKDSWNGTYSFLEGVPRGNGNVGNVSHSITIYQSGKNLVANLEASGWQIEESLKCTTKIVGNRINLYFKSYGNTGGEPMQRYKKGALLLSLVRSGNKILTYWGAYKPMALKNGKSGKVYFKEGDLEEQ